MEKKLYTKDNPTCFHGALKHFSELTGISAKKKIYIKNIDDLYSRGHKKPKLKYKSYNITVMSEDGRSYLFINPDNNQRFDKEGIIANHFITWEYRKLEDFGIPFVPAGKYQDSYPQSEGGGYAVCQMYKAGDFYFVPAMECAH